MQVKVSQGTCGWQDQQYPENVKKDSKSKLDWYSKTWPCVEVNSSTYAIPSPTTTTAWAKAVPENFIFHFKAFGLFCSRGSKLSHLPGEVRDMLPPGRYGSDAYVPMSELPAAAVDKTWRLFHAALEPVYRQGKLGVVTFQFHLSFQPSDASLRYVLECRRRLDGRFRMAAEFRCRRWFTEEPWRQRTCTALEAQGIAWVAADELEHETEQKDREQTGLAPGQKSIVLPIALEVTCSEFFYVRVHRRHGTWERKLDEEEIAAWTARLETVVASGKLQGPIYFLWGTEHREIPMRNAANLRASLPEGFCLDWKPKPAAGSIAALFGAAEAKALPAEKKNEGEAVEEESRLAPVFLFKQRQKKARLK